MFNKKTTVIYSLIQQPIFNVSQIQKGPCVGIMCLTSAPPAGPQSFGVREHPEPSGGGSQLRGGARRDGRRPRPAQPAAKKRPWGWGLSMASPGAEGHRRGPHENHHMQNHLSGGSRRPYVLHMTEPARRAFLCCTYDVY